MSVQILNAEIKRLSQAYPHVSVELLQSVALKTFSESCRQAMCSTVFPRLEQYAKTHTAERLAGLKSESGR